MRVIINDDYFIVIDSLNFVLKRNFVIKDNKKINLKRAAIMGYYGDMKGVIKAILREELVQNQDGTLNDYIKLLENQEQQINDFIDKIYIEKKLDKRGLKKRINKI